MSYLKIEINIISPQLILEAVSLDDTVIYCIILGTPSGVLSLVCLVVTLSRTATRIDATRTVSSAAICAHVQCLIFCLISLCKPTFYRVERFPENCTEYFRHFLLSHLLRSQNLCLFAGNKSNQLV